MMTSRTTKVDVRLPDATMSMFGRFAKLSGVPVEKVVQVCLAIQVAQSEDLMKAAANAAPRMPPNART